MAVKKKPRLKKELKLFDVYAVGTGTTLSAGFFLLPGIAATDAGPAMVLSYLLAALPLIPAMLSVAELATAMPRAGGVYYFLDRTLGPLVGTIGGVGTWLALILKVSFALIGMGAYTMLFLPDLPLVPVAIGLALAIGLLNVFGAKKSGKLQSVLVIGLLALLALFIGGGTVNINPVHFRDFLDSGFASIVSTAGLVYISYVGVTKIASLSEEVQNPERNIPLGLFLSLGTSLVVYGAGTFIMVGVIPPDMLRGSLTPVADAAGIMFGIWGTVLLSIAALFAFVSVANAGTLSASRYPLAMSRDHIFPRFFSKLTKQGTPLVSIVITVGIIVAILLTIDPKGIAKLASAFQLLMFALVSIAVIIMRESRIEAYDPGYKAPFYPWLHIMGIILSIWFIAEMGPKPILFSLGLVVVSILWYWGYARKRVLRTGAIYHIFERLGHFKYDGLDRELRGLMKKKGLRDDDPFNEIVARATVLDYDTETDFDDVVDKVADCISLHSVVPPIEIRRRFLEGNQTGATPVTHGFALPHLRLEGISKTELVLVRAKKGMHVALNNPLNDNPVEDEVVTAAFFLASPLEDPAQHLRILANIASRVDERQFHNEWAHAASEEELKIVLARENGAFTITIDKKGKTQFMAEKPLREIPIEDGCLVVGIRRGEEIIVPRGETVCHHGDRLTVIGEPQAITTMKRRCGMF